MSPPASVFAAMNRGIFDGESITVAYKSKRPVRDMEQTIEIAKKDFKVRCFVNLVNFNALWGHRRDPVEYGHELERFDEKLDVMLHEIKDDDFLIITTDHGNDPTYTGLYMRKGVVLTYYSKSMLNSGIAAPWRRRTLS